MQRADKRKFHYIYKITRDDGRFYIGMHSTDVLEDGYFGSGKLITRSIKKHGVDRHTKEILEFCDSREELRMLESSLVNEELIADKMCMNLQLGGFGGFINQDHQRKCSSAGLNSYRKKLKNEDYRNNVCENISKATKKSHAAGNAHKIDTNMWVGKTQTEVHVEKRKATFAERGHMQGEKNSQFGTCWVTNGIKPVKIKKDLLDEYLAKGFIRGRKLVL